MWVKPVCAVGSSNGLRLPVLKRTLTDNVRGTKRHRPADQPGGKNALMAALPAGARAGNRPARGGADRPARGGRETPERARHTARRGPSSTRPADDLVQAGRSLLDGKAARRATQLHVYRQPYARR
ncbi:hypothetical protein GCM10022285_66750 [Streptomyces tunisiensis]|uniref:Uncharacterized protein n=1 Tax=Streptomyces tunisiensis TaxID=948699 RepID=A0ABP7ZCF7_9ACTN